MITKERRRNLFYAILALFFSVLLFFTANGSNFQSNFAGTENNYEEILTQVPIQPIYNSDAYFIQGFETTVTVKLSSANRIQLNAETNPETRNFRVIADLSELKEGTHDVRLRIQNLSSSVKATIEPSTIAVTIEKRVTKAFTVEPIVSDSNLTEGYQIENIAVSPQKVQIITGDQTLKEIDRVVAIVDPQKMTNQNLSEDVKVQALDAKGDVLGIIATPETVKVDVTLSAPTKNVELYVSQDGTQPKNVSYYIFKMSQISAQISGAQSALDEIEQIAVPIDISGIDTTVQKTVTIPVADGITVLPERVTVEITPVLSETSSNSSRSSGGASQGNSNKSSGGSSSADGESTGSAVSESSQQSDSTSVEESNDNKDNE